MDFSLKPYEWQKEMEILFPNSNLKNFNFSGTSGIEFQFLNSFDGNFLGILRCEEIWKIQHEIDTTLTFPAFVGDVRVKDLRQDEKKDVFRYLNYGYEIPEVQKCYLVCVNGGEINTTIICGKIEINQ